MMKFIDGPAAGVVLGIRRAPVLLRVVRFGDGDLWDALDQVDDVPRERESIYVYVVVNKPEMVHLNMGRKKGSGYYPMGQYRLVSEQPSDAILRSRAAWAAWCQERRDLWPAWMNDQPA